MAAKLDVEAVRRALTEDFTALSAKQARILALELAPIAREANGYLAIAVNRGGVEALNTAGRILWTLGELPLCEERARALLEWHNLDEDVAEVERRAKTATDLVDDLRRSAPLRTLLQTVLVVRNVLGQQACPGFTVESLTGLSSERLPRHIPTTFDPATGLPIAPTEAFIRENNPSVLTTVVQMLEATHAYRCRLRFLRMMAVGRLTLQRGNVCRIIWSYLDDLQESPRDVVQLLERCQAKVCNHDQFNTMDDYRRSLRRFQSGGLPALRDAVLARRPAPAQPYLDQVDRVIGKVADAVMVCSVSLADLEGAAAQLCQLTKQARGSSPIPAEKFRGSERALCDLQALGNSLAVELWRFQRLQEEERRLAHAGNPRTARLGWRTARPWHVETGYLSMGATSDPDLIRELRRAERQRQAAQRSEEDGAAAETEAMAAAQAAGADEAPVKGTARCAVHYADLVHGGLEGVYRRDPVTGKWGRRLDGVDGTGGAGLRLGGPTVDA